MKVLCVVRLHNLLVGRKMQMSNNKYRNVQHYLYMEMTSFHLSCEGWANWIIQLHDICFTICILLPLAQVHCQFKQLEAVFHAQPLLIHRHSESLLLGCCLWSHIDWWINQQVNAGPGVASWQTVKAWVDINFYCSTHSNLHVQTTVFFILQSSWGYAKPQLFTYTLSDRLLRLGMLYVDVRL